MSTSGLREGWKVFTHDYHSPLQGGPAVWDGRDHAILPSVDLDTGLATCAGGWNYCATLADAYQVAGLWSDGRPKYRDKSVGQ